MAFHIWIYTYLTVCMSETEKLILECQYESSKKDEPSNNSDAS